MDDNDVLQIVTGLSEIKILEKKSGDGCIIDKFYSDDHLRRKTLYERISKYGYCSE